MPDTFLPEGEPLAFTPDVAARTEAAYRRLENIIPRADWELFAPEIDAIQRLKRERNAIVLAHNYQTPDIFHGVADIVGDSLALARQASHAEADVIVLAGVHFMAETAKLVNPEKTVLMPDMDAGCSLASAITAADVRGLRETYPGVPIVCYVNTSADVKAECDISCTSGNAIKIVESLGAEKVIMLPDRYLADWVAENTDVEVIAWQGSCEVHERFTAEEVRQFRSVEEDLTVVAHPECPGDVLREADHVGSTADMINFVKEQAPKRVLLLTECSMSDNVAAETPDVEFVRTCNLCPHMKKITLTKIRRSLETMTPEIVIDPGVAVRARACVERMLAVS